MLIGGEFEIGILPDYNSCVNLPHELSKGHYYSSGRAALFHILNFSKKSGKYKILLPDYLCESIVEIVKFASVSFDFYKINQDLSININSIKETYSNDCSILIINYFGGVDIQNEILKIKSLNSNAYIILDNVQAFYKMFESYEVDFMFTSFRKQLPVPDGAWVISKYIDLFSCEEENTFAQYKFAGGLLKKVQAYNSISDQIYLDLFKKGESLINQNLNSKISDITIAVLSETNFELMHQQRIENASYLMAGLQNLEINPILNFQDNMVPLFVPILIRNRDYLRQQLSKNGIFCPVHWPKYKEISYCSNRLYDEELSLVIDQRYERVHMRKILEVLEISLLNE